MESLGKWQITANPSSQLEMSKPRVILVEAARIDFTQEYTIAIGKGPAWIELNFNLYTGDWVFWRESEVSRRERMKAHMTSYIY